ncbi:unnamed protein product [Brassica rapa]|uniref:Uncharacterized protein n=2 Tax=Brassica TaxID=3705 RepID=A0A3P5ZXS8_BRACM|nr:unnamed protein product [Brassica napus]CAG7880174.1 unnamed protein product [Brassica rapa]CDY47060.1 BnaA03g12380D [Brassica napus]VDC79603.1 unnamed protein product [Brassica rapa]
MRFEILESRFKELESEKLVLEEEVRKLKESDDDSLVEQMMVNKALEFEKQVAENKSEEWKRKFEKLAEAVRKLDDIGAFRVGEVELDEDVKVGLELAGLGKKKIESLCREGLVNHHVSGCSPCVTTPVKDCSMSGRNRDDVSSRRRVNKMLVFEGDDGKCTDVVDLSDSETEERSVGEEECEDEDVEACEGNTNAGRKRKRVITSDSENDDNDDDDDEDNIPIATLKNLKQPPQKHEVDAPSAGENNVSGGSRRQRRVSSRLRKQRRPLEEIEGHRTERLVGIPITGNAHDDDDTEEEESERESEGESLNGFIVDDDDECASEEGSDGAVSEEEEEEGGSDGETGYADVMARLRRDKKPGEHKWDLEGEMLAAFGKDPELCMRAVCVLYRFQTEGEKATRSSHVANGRGFSMADADRGTRIGQFLTDGDPEGDLKKSVEELRRFECNAVEICSDLARHYSKQLFEIYNNREDPFFAAPPSP